MAKRHAPPRTLRTMARGALKDAQSRGVVGEFSVRPHGRATIYRPDGEGKFYTVNLLDTLAVIKQLEKETEEDT